MLHLEVLSGQDVESSFDAAADVVRVGRARTNDLVLSDERVAPAHLRLDVVGGETLLRSLPGARTWIERHGAAQALEGGSVAFGSDDVIVLGDLDGGVRLRVRLEPDEEQHVLEVQPLSALPRETSSQARNAELLRCLSELHLRVTGASDIDQTLIEIADAALVLVPRATHVTVILPDSQAPEGAPSGYLPTLVRTRDPKSGLLATARDGEPKIRSVYRRVVRERASVLAVDAPSAGFSSESLQGADVRSIIGVPLWRRDEIVGVIQVDSRGAPALFDHTDLDALGILACNASLAIANARSIEKLVRAEKELKSENVFLKRREQARRQELELIGESGAMRELLAQIDKVAPTRVPVLVEGETGAGKELVASRIHARSGRESRLFVAQNCAALPENLLESELFGHRRGAFTGATEEKKGLFEVANGGTLFLDEISEIPLNLQAKLLRILQEGELRPLGATREKTVDVRVVAASNRPLAEEVKAGRFREDLYYRLSVFPLRVPALRERQQDIPLLARHFLTEFCREIGKPMGDFSETALALLKSYPWPGNVRELKNEVQRVVIQAEAKSRIEPSLLSAGVRRAEDAAQRSASEAGTLKERLEHVERFMVLETLREHGNNKTAAAKALGITREGLHKKLRLLKIEDA